MSKRIEISLWELTKQEASALPDGTSVLVYNPLTSDYSIDRIGRNCLARHKHTVPNLKYFSFEEV